MIVAVTGGTGFIGKKLIARLMERGDTVRLLTRHPAASETAALLEVHECDLLTMGVNDLALILHGVDVLYHCAGQLKDEHAMRSLHVDSTRKLAEAASGNIDHWVQLSSVGVYGPVAQGDVTENSKLNPLGQYEITKAESEKIVVNAANKGGFSCSILRPSNVFGSSMTNQSLFRMVAMIDRGIFFYIGQPGASANYIHVDNVIEGLVRCGTMHQAKGRTYNLSDYCTMEHFVETIAAALNRRAPKLRIPETLARLAGIIFGKLPGFPLTLSRTNALVKRSRYPVVRIQHELDYHPVISMEEGLQELVAGYKQRARPL